MSKIVDKISFPDTHIEVATHRLGDDGNQHTDVNAAMVMMLVAAGALVGGAALVAGTYMAERASETLAHASKRASEGIHNASVSLRAGFARLFGRKPTAIILTPKAVVVDKAAETVVVTPNEPSSPKL